MKIDKHILTSSQGEFVHIQLQLRHLSIPHVNASTMQEGGRT